MAEPWALAVPDWEERIRAGRSLLPALPLLDQEEATRAIGIFNKLKLPDVVGTPTLAEAGGDWFREIVGAVLHAEFILGVLREKPDTTLEEMAARLAAERGVRVVWTTVWKFLARHGQTHKKRPPCQ